MFTAVTMKNVVFWIKKPVRTSQETVFRYIAQPDNAMEDLGSSQQ
jgi:hypothetical protein